MTIIERIFREIVQLGREGKKPARVYLGEAEWVELRRRAQEYGIIPSRDLTRRPWQFDGLDIYEVKEAHHLFVA